jgi:hypothetical protein
LKGALIAEQGRTDAPGRPTVEFLKSLPDFEVVTKKVESISD